MPRKRERERERGRAEEKRVNRAKAGLSGGQRHTETDGRSRQRPLSFRRTGLCSDRSLCDCLGWAKAAKGMTDRTGQDKTG